MATPTPPAPHGMSPRAEKLVQRLSTFAVTVLAVSAAILSFGGLQRLALNAGFPENVAWLMPVIVDGLVLTGSLGVIAAGLVGLRTWYAWSLTLLGVAISVAGNVASAPANLTSQLVHAIAPVVFALSVEGMLMTFRAGAHAGANREAVAAAAEERKLERDARAAERAARLAAMTSPAPAQASAVPQRATSVTASVSAFPSASVAAPAVEQAPEESALTARERIERVIAQDSTLSGGQIARNLGIDPSYTRKILRDIRDDADAARTLEQ